jgi:hypothetical protein
MGFQTLLVAFLADLLSFNRRLLEDVRFRVASLEEKDRKSGVDLKKNEHG